MEPENTITNKAINSVRKCFRLANAHLLLDMAREEITEDDYFAWIHFVTGCEDLLIREAKKYAIDEDDDESENFNESNAD